MIGYVTLGTADISRAAAFYDALLAEIGARRGMQDSDFVSWTVGAGAPALSVITPHNGEPATVGNGTMVALIMPDTDTVDRVYAKALDLGAADEGPAGTRGTSGFYAGYFRDLDGNKLCVFHVGAG